jgi:S1/P1 Nuclease
MASTRAGLTFPLLCLLLTQAASAWGPLGHHAVGAVADALLTPGARAEVARLLQGDRRADGSPSGRTTLAEVSTWADEIRGNAQDRPPWHYDNAPVCAAVARDRPWCALQQCASARIESLLGLLADRERAAAQRRDALKWIAHLAADLHQPLHAAGYAQGGNLVHVELAGGAGASTWTLHAAWDVRLVASALHAHGSQEPPESALRSLIARARRLDPAQREAAVSQWLNESNRIARETALDYPGFDCERVPGGTVVLSTAYQQRAQRVIRSQLALAGARLAAALNRALSTP